MGASAACRELLCTSSNYLLEILLNLLLTMAQDKKLILVIGATGAQGIAVIDALLAPSADGSPSPYAVRALTRDPESGRAKALAEKGAELVKGMH